MPSPRNAPQATANVSPRDGVQRPPAFDPSAAAAAETLARVHLAVERSHDRRAVLTRRAAGENVDLPDWRFHRQVIRLALYMSERLGVGPGDRIALVGSASFELAAVDWATLVLGGVVVPIDASSSAEELANALEAVSPRLAFVAPDAVDRVLAARARAGRVDATNVIEVDGPVPSTRATSFVKILDLGGTLDTAERAQNLRARARSVTEDMPAYGFLDGDAPGKARWTFATHQTAVAELRRFWSRTPTALAGRAPGGPAAAGRQGQGAGDGDVAYFEGTASGPAARLALRAFVADGRTRSILGTPGHEREEIAALRPRWIITRHGTGNVP
jgi:hypothetical protein